SEQDWLKTNLARVTGMLPGQRDLATVGQMLLSELTPLVGAQQGVIYGIEAEESDPGLNLVASYAGGSAADLPARLSIGEGLLGQCAAEKERILIGDVPSSAVPIRSGLFEAVPRNVVVLPVMYKGEAKAVLENVVMDRVMDVSLNVV